MNRRSFLKFLPAGVIGARQAAAEAAEKLALPGAGNLLAGADAMAPVGSVVGDIGGEYGTPSWARKSLMRLVDPTVLANKRRDMSVSALDPDLASMRSMSLSVRIEMQRERNLQRSIDRERSYLNSFLEKVFD